MMFRFRVLTVAFLAFGAVLTAAEPPPRAARGAAPRRPEEKKSEAKPNDRLAAALAELARLWWRAVMNGDAKSAGAFVASPEINLFMLQYVQEMKNAGSPESRLELESMRRLVFGKAAEQTGSIVVTATKDGEPFLKLFFRKRNGKWLIHTIN